jgi:hypothetical protein
VSADQSSFSAEAGSSEPQTMEKENTSAHFRRQKGFGLVFGLIFIFREDRNSNLLKANSIKGKLSSCI